MAKVLLFSLLLTLSLADISCSSYYCDSTSFTLANNCGVYLPFNDTYYLTTCPSGSYCPAVSPSANSTCQLIVPVSTLAWPGEPCGAYTPCAFGNCTAGFCVGAATTAPCSLNDECMPGNYCNAQGFCTAQITTTGCTNDYQCQAGSGCNVSVFQSAGNCVPYFSVEAGTLINQCEGGISEMCASGHCYQATIGAVCSDVVTSQGTVPITCTQDSQCTSTIDKTNEVDYTQLCTCGFTGPGSAYCPAFWGDPAGQTFLGLITAWVQNSNINNCNTVRRFSPGCMQMVMGKANFTQYMASYYQFTMYPLLQGNSECVKAMYTSPYWTLSTVTSQYAEGAGIALALAMWTLLALAS